MEKVKTISDKELNMIKKALTKNKMDVIKNILSIDINKNIEIRKSVVLVNNASVFDVYKDNWKDHEIWYDIITEVIDNKRAFAYSVYDIHY